MKTEITGMTQQQDHQDELVGGVVAENPRFWDEVKEELPDYRQGNFWKTEEGFLDIGEMSDEHLVNALRHATNKLSDLYNQQKALERRTETMALKRRQLRKEIQKRGIEDHQHVFVTVGE